MTQHRPADPDVSYRMEMGKPHNVGKIDYGRWMDWGASDKATIDADTAHRADVQHSLVLAGDPRGIYGDYPPADFGENVTYL